MSEILDVACRSAGIFVLLVIAALLIRCVLTGIYLLCCLPSRLRSIDSRIDEIVRTRGENPSRPRYVAATFTPNLASRPSSDATTQPGGNV